MGALGRAAVTGGHVTAVHDNKVQLSGMSGGRRPASGRHGRLRRNDRASAQTACGGIFLLDDDAGCLPAVPALFWLGGAGGAGRIRSGVSPACPLQALCGPDLTGRLFRPLCDFVVVGVGRRV